PTTDQAAERPVDVFFPGGSKTTDVVVEIPKPSDETKPAEAVVETPAETDAPELSAVPGVRLIQVNPLDIVPNPRQPRTHFNEDDLAELVHSVKEFGVLQPVVVRRNADGEYELIMGERRTRAAREAGLESIPAILRETADEDLLRDALLENLHRSQLNPLEEASAYQQLLEDFGITQEELATRIGRSRPQVSNTIRLLKLPVPVQQRVAAGVLSAGHARAILSLEDAERMQRLADKVVNEDLSVRATEQAAKTMPETAEKSVKPQPGARRAYLDEVGSKLGDRLNTRVHVTLGARKGQVKIDFASIQDLNRILGELGEEEYGTR
ncbi:MAG: ParB/RepB/Spo0J family partition protein, partial [Microbacterium sp.]|nr:ParB/RepB/Spo0J family partition protein [Microbacterium sp.]